MNDEVHHTENFELAPSRSWAWFRKILSCQGSTNTFGEGNVIAEKTSEKTVSKCMLQWG